MTEFKINHIDTQEVEAWCMRFIGPRLYYLPKQIGGQGWMIKRQYAPAPVVAIEDDKRALMAIIRFGA